MKQVLKCGQLFLAQEKRFAAHQNVYVEDGRITEVSTGPVKEGWEVVDLGGKYVLPGLIDGHIHSNLSGGPNDMLRFGQMSVPEFTVVSLVNVQADLMAGFTTVRDEGAIAFTDVAVKNAINRGQTWGPRMFVSGPALSPTGGHADTHFPLYMEQTEGMGLLCDSPDECRAAGRYAMKYGADQLKIMSTGGVMTKGDDVGAPAFTLEELQAIVDLANSRGRITSAHAHAGDGIKLAVRAGVTVIEHATMADEEAREMMRQAGTWVVPTLSPGVSILRYGPEAGLPDWLVEKDREVVQTHASNVKKFFEMGIPMAFGTDCGTSFNYHGKQAYEFQLLHQAGIPAAETLAMATINAAKMMRMDDKVGSVEAGKLADIVAVDANPIADLSVMMNVSFVMKDGKIYKQ